MLNTSSIIGEKGRGAPQCTLLQIIYVFGYREKSASTPMSLNASNTRHIGGKMETPPNECPLMQVLHIFDHRGKRPRRSPMSFTANHMRLRLSGNKCEHPIVPYCKQYTSSAIGKKVQALPKSFAASITHLWSSGKNISCTRNLLYFN